MTTNYIINTESTNLYYHNFMNYFHLFPHNQRDLSHIETLVVIKDLNTITVML